MKLHTIKYEPNKGYIPYDKVRTAKNSFESYSFSHILELKEKIEIIKKDYMADKYENFKKHNKYTYKLDNIVIDFLTRAGVSGVVPHHQYFYFNFNHDGIDIFINRNIDSLIEGYKN